MKPVDLIRKFKNELDSTQSNGGCDIAIRPAQDNLDNTHFQECIRLHSQNKIDENNAFALSLIDYVHSLLIKGMFRNFELAVPSLAAGTKIYAARVDAVYRCTRQVLSKLTRARCGTSENGTAAVHSSVTGNGTSTEEEHPVTTSTPKKKSRRSTCRPRIVAPGGLSRVRLASPPNDDFLFRQMVVKGDLISADHAELNNLVGAEEAEEDTMVTIDIPFDHRVLDPNVAICHVSKNFVFIPHYVPCYRSSIVAVTPSNPSELPEMIKLSDIKMEMDTALKRECVEIDSDDPHEDLCQPLVSSVTGSVAPLPEIVCHSVEEYVKLLRDNIRSYYQRHATDEDVEEKLIDHLQLTTRRSTRRRPLKAHAYSGKEYSMGTRRKRTKRRTVKRECAGPEPPRCRAKKSRVQKEEQPSSEPLLDPTLQLDPPPPSPEADDDVEFVTKFDLISDSDDDRDVLMMSEECMSNFHLNTSQTNSVPAVDVRSLIRTLRRVVCLKYESAANQQPKSFSGVVETLRRMTGRPHLSPAMVLFCLLHVAEREHLNLIEKLSDIEISQTR